MAAGMRPTAEVRRFLEDQSGSTATEYAIMLALIVLASAAAITSVGSGIMGLYTSINAAIPD